MALDLTSFLVALLLSFWLLKIWKPWISKGVPVYGSPYLPPFVRGIQAIAAMSANEDAFLMSLLNTYGPVVYIPWPMGHYYILSSKGIDSVFAAPEKSLTFTSFRLKMTESAFGLRARDLRFWTDTIYPMHAKGMTRAHLADSFQKFYHVFANKVDDLRAQVAHGSVEIDLVQWVTDAVFDAGLAAVWGLEFVERVSNPTNAFHKMLDRFDNSFPIVASGLIPPLLYPFLKPTRDFVQSRDALKRILSAFVQDGTPGLDDGVIHDVTQVLIREKFSADDAASFLLTILWALQQNTPFATVTLFVRALQMPGLIERLRAELDVSGAMRGGDIDESKLHDSTPLMMSCIYETLRLETSAISFRYAQEDYIINVSDDPAPRHVLLPKDAFVMAHLRVPHIAAHDNSAQWDPERFLPRTGYKEELATLLKEFRGFGGGVSMCEGRHLAVSEMKTALACFISALDVEPVEDAESMEEINVRGGVKVFGPKKDRSRTGLGAYHFIGGMKVRVSLRK
ncbi:cytochrome P450 [Mucidula mucida]|nr:cytochrome P450 [Mucidula mucida]